MRWLDPICQFPVQLFIYKGFETINYAAAYGSGATTGYGAKNFDYELYQLLIPVPVEDWYPEVATYRRAPPHYTEILSGWAIGSGLVDDNLLPGVLLTPGEIGQWLLHEMGLVKLRSERYDGIFQEASKLIRLGYQLLRLSGRKYSFNSTTFSAALCMVGLGSAYYFRREINCPNCFRIASPLLGRCKHHSQSKHAYLENRSHSLNSQSARTGRRVMSTLKWPEHFPPGMLPGILSEWRTAGMLWPLHGKQHSNWNEIVAEALHNAPLVRQLLPEIFLSLPNKTQLELLRDKLDENEWEIMRWPIKIQSAQKWFEIEEIVAPGKISGFNEINAERLKQACAMRDQGHKPMAIATKLGISQSHLSQLWRRQKLRNKG